MPTTILDSIASHAADREELADDEGMRKEYLKRYKALLTNAKLRDPELWTDAFTKLGLDVETWGGLTPQQLNQFKVSQRGIKWRLVNKTLFAVAQIEAFMDVYLGDIMESSEKHSKAVNSKARQLSKKEAESIAKEGIKIRLRNEKEKRKKTKEGNDGSSEKNNTGKDI